MSAAATIDWGSPVASLKPQTGAPMRTPASAGASGGIDWNSPVTHADAATAGSRFGVGYRAGLGLPTVRELGTAQANLHAAEHPGESLAQAARGIWGQYKGDETTAQSHLIAPGWRNKVLGGEEALEGAIPFFGHGLVDMQERSNSGDTAGSLGEAAGLLTGALGPEAARETRELLPAASSKAANLFEGARTSPEEVGERASGRLIASATQRQSAIRDALTQAKKNVAPLYENLHAADEAANPEGAIQLPEDVGKEFAPTAEKSPRLTVGEAQDLDRRVTAGSTAPTRRQAAAAFASKQLASGMGENDVRQVLRNQYGFTSNQAAAVIGDASEPSADGGYTIAKARAMRAQVARAARTAERAGQHAEAVRLNRTYGNTTDAMRDRGQQLDPTGKLAQQFDRADAKWSDIRSAEKTLAPLLEAKSGKYANPEDFQKAWDKLDSNQRRELQLLARDAGLDLDALKSGGKTAGKVLAGVHPKPANWMDRYVKGYIPLRLAAAAGTGWAAHEFGKHGDIPEWARDSLYIAPMLGYAGAGYATPLLARGAALGAIEDLPPELAREGFGPEEPELITPRTVREGPEPIAPQNRGVTPGRELELSPRIGPRRQIAPYNGPTPGGLTVDARALPGMVEYPRYNRQVPLLAARNVNDLGASDSMIAPGQRLALPQGVAVGTGEPPTGGIRTIGRNVIGPRGDITGHVEARELLSPNASEAAAAPAPMKVTQTAEVTGLENRLKQIEDRISTARTESAAKKLLRERQDISDKLDQVRKRGAKYGIEGRYPAPVLQAAKEELQSALSLWNDLPAPERIRVDEPEFPGGSTGGPQKAGGEWVGVRSPRGSVEDLYPWVKDFPQHGLSDLREALRKGKGAAYEAWLDAAAKYIEDHGIEGGHE